MGHFLTPVLMQQYEKTVRYLREDIGDIIYVTLRKDTNQTQCNNCLWDIEAQRSTGVYNGTGPKPFTNGKCPVCKNTGILTSGQKTIAINCTYIWLKQGDREITVAGKGEGNYVRLRTDRGYKTYFQNAEFAMIDGVRMEVDRFMPAGFGRPKISCEILFRRSD